MTAKGRRAAGSPAAIGWQTSDEHEIELRRQRGAAELQTAERIDGGRGPYGAWRVPSASGEVYVVEIRSLVAPVNSCGCADHRANGLGTCKHVEGLLQRLRARRDHAAARDAGNPLTELFLDRREGRPAVQWGARRGRAGKAEQIVRAACAQQGGSEQLSAPVVAGVVAALARLPRAQRERVRVSRYLQDWLEEARERESAREARRTLERELDAGRPVLDVLRVPLYPYQQQGVLHLAFTRRAILADEMGLGKTIQAIGACELLARRERVARVLVVCPASLKGEWAEQIEQFTPRGATLVDGPARRRRELYGRSGFYWLVNYEQVRQDVEAINESLAPEVVILDEAQRIKNWRTATATQVKRLRSRHAFVLTGTPLENRIDDVYSIAQFLDPALFGSLFRFNREFYVLDERGRPAGYRNLDEMHRRLRPVMLRRRKADVEDDLPARSVSNHFVAMAPEQEDQYAQHQGDVARLVAIARRRPLRQQEFERLQRALACMRMACDTPYILDRDCRVSPKLDELVALLDELFEGTDSKAVVFSEWQRMLELARERTRRVAPDSAWHTGSLAQKKRREEIRRFREHPDCRLLFSTDSGSVGLNLQVADVVINLDLPWNPAKLEQRIARAWRKHQRRNVRVVNLVSEGTIEQRMLETLEHKRRVAEDVIDGEGGAGMVPLGSGRAALIERIERLTAADGQAAADAAPAPADTLETRLGALLGNNLLQTRRVDGADGAATLLVVLRADDDGARKTVEGCLASAGETPHPRVEIVDAAAWGVVERLLEAGVLQLGDGAAAAAPGADERRKQRRRERASKAAKALERAAREQAMARLLHDGGFRPEAVAALRRAFDAVAAGWAALEGAGEEDGGSPQDPGTAVESGSRADSHACRETLDGDLGGVDVDHCLSVLERVHADARQAIGGQ